MTSAKDLSVNVRKNIHHTLCLQGEENNKSKTLWSDDSGGTGERRSIPVARSTPVRYVLYGSVTRRKKSSQVAIFFIIAPTVTLVCVAIWQ